MPPRIVPSNLDVENDMGPIAEFIAHTNSLTTLGRSLSEAYPCPNTLTSQIRGNVLAERLAAGPGADVAPAKLGLA